MCSPAEARRVPLYGKRGQGLYALVDAEDYDRVMQYKWYKLVKPTGTVYAVSRPLPIGAGRRRTLSLHRFVLHLSHGQGEVDHQNRQGLDCRKDNLRLAGRGQNLANRGLSRNNTSGYKGVSWDKNTAKWHARCWQGKRAYSLGYFDDPMAAARAYDEAARRLHGEFALPNSALSITDRAS